MRDGFAAVRPVIDDDAVTAVIEAFFFGNMPRGKKQLAQKRFIPILSLRDAFDFAFRNDEDVSRSLRIDVSKGEQSLRFIDNVCRDLPRDDFLENGFCHKHRSASQ